VRVDCSHWVRLQKKGTHPISSLSFILAQNYFKMRPDACIYSTLTCSNTLRLAKNPPQTRSDVLTRDASTFGGRRWRPVGEKEQHDRQQCCRHRRLAVQNDRHLVTNIRRQLTALSNSSCCSVVVPRRRRQWRRLRYEPGKEEGGRDEAGHLKGDDEPGGGGSLSGREPGGGQRRQRPVNHNARPSVQCSADEARHLQTNKEDAIKV
jgi:hypothetical protein